MFAFPDQPQFEAKSLTLRAILYPIFSFFMAGAWYFKKMKGQYPHLTDFLWSVTFTFDIVGNDLNLYISYAKFDDLVHFINGVPFMFVLFAFLYSLENLGKIKLGFWGIMLFAFLIHTSAHAFWEMWEYGMDRYFGTFLQPGGMAEATENNLAGILGSIVGIMLLKGFWRTSWFEKNLFSPTQSFLKQLLS